MSEKQGHPRRGLSEAWLPVVIVAAMTVLGALALSFRLFNTPSGSMSPTLVPGDYFVVSTWAYGYGRYSFPFIPKNFVGRLLGAAPKRGDIAVFAVTRNPDTAWVKRVVGLPGDEIQMKKGRLYVNGAVVARREISDEFAPRAADDKPAIVYEETLPGGHSHEIAEMEGDGGRFDDTEVFAVPPGHYFVMGDNRDNSLDSRMSGNFGVGFVPYENLIGKALFIYFSRGEDGLRISRIGRDLR